MKGKWFTKIISVKINGIPYQKPHRKTTHRKRQLITSQLIERITYWCNMLQNDNSWINNSKISLKWKSLNASQIIFSFSVNAWLREVEISPLFRLNGIKTTCLTMVSYNYAIGKMKKKTHWDVNGAIKKQFNSMWKVMFIGIYMWK